LPRNTAKAAFHRRSSSRPERAFQHGRRALDAHAAPSEHAQGEHRLARLGRVGAPGEGGEPRHRLLVAHLAQRLDEGQPDRLVLFLVQRLEEVGLHRGLAELPHGEHGLRARALVLVPQAAGQDLDQGQTLDPAQGPEGPRADLRVLVLGHPGQDAVGRVPPLLVGEDLAKDGLGDPLPLGVGGARPSGQNEGEGGNEEANAHGASGRDEARGPVRDEGAKCRHGALPKLPPGAARYFSPRGFHVGFFGIPCGRPDLCGSGARGFYQEECPSRDASRGRRFHVETGAQSIAVYPGIFLRINHLQILQL
jgi:hypothetical protein